MAADPLDRIAEICHDQPHDALTLIAEVLGFGQMEPSPVNYLRFHAQNLIAQYGSVRKAADALGIDHAYLYRIAAGEKEWPSDDVLLRMGLERVVTYRKYGNAGVTAGPICHHGIHMDNACGACIPPRGTTVRPPDVQAAGNEGDDLSRVAQVIADFADLPWHDCKELARRIAGVLGTHETGGTDGR